jgi:hypothetical protein
MRASWYLIDALLKECPAVFVPVIAPKLCDYVRHQMPWHAVKNEHAQHSNVAALLWCDELIRSWVDVLPPALYAEVMRTAVQLRQGHEVDAHLSLHQVFSRSNSRQGAGAVMAVLSGGDPDVEVIERPATKNQIERLAADWDSLVDMVLRPVAVDPSSLAPQPTMLLAAAQPDSESAAKEQLVAPPPQPPGGAVEDDGDDVEFVPLPGIGSAAPRALPPLSLAGEVAVSRAPRKRPR